MNNAAAAGVSTESLQQSTPSAAPFPVGWRATTPRLLAVIVSRSEIDDPLVERQSAGHANPIYLWGLFNRIN